MSSVVPTKGNFVAVKKSSSLAKLGYELMDKKRGILIRELMLVIKQIRETCKEVQDTFVSAYSSFGFSSLTLGTNVVEGITSVIPEDFSLKLSYRSVMGVEIPVVSLKEPKLDSLRYGFYNSNSALDETYKKFCKVKALSAKLAELEISVYKLSSAIKKTQKRANALNNIVIPRFKGFMKYISESLEEKDREEFSRLKVVKKHKNKGAVV